MSLAQEILEELLDLLSAEDNDASPEEIMDQIVTIVEDYKSELELDETEKTQREQLEMMGVDPDEEDEESDDDSDDDDSVTATNKPVNRAFLLAKAQKEYYRKLGLSQDDIDDFTPAEKIKHREGVTKLFNKMVREAMESEDDDEPKQSKLSKGPFKSSVKRVADEDDDEDEDEDDDDVEVGAAQQKWNRKRKLELKRQMRQIDSDIDELKRQNKIPKISRSIINRNLERIEALEEEREDLEEQLERYK